MYHNLLLHTMQYPVLIRVCINMKSKKAVRKKVITELELPQEFFLLTFLNYFCSALWVMFQVTYDFEVEGR